MKTRKNGTRCQGHACMYYSLNEAYIPKKQPKGMNLAIILERGGIVIKKR